VRETCQVPDQINANSEVRPREDHRGVDLICDALPFGRLWYAEPNAAANAVDYAKFYSHSHDAVNEFLIRTSLS
jgi:hypothetical protein